MLASKSDRVFIAGAYGMVGSAIVRALKSEGFENLLCPTKSELDVTRQDEVESFYSSEKPEYVFIAAAKVGGIHANETYPADFIFENLQIECNLIHSAYLAKVVGLTFLGSSCIYPKFSEQPISESALLQSSLEASNEPYAVAKIAGIKMCEAYNRQYNTDFRSLMPSNLYGPGDNFHLEDSHVIPALIQRLHHAKQLGDNEVEIWGTGEAYREFLHVDDLASACVDIAQLPREKINAVTTRANPQINIGSGTEITIRTLAENLARILGYKGNLVFDRTRTDGTPRKLLDISRARELGWQPQIKLEDGLASTYQWYLDNQNSLRK